MKWRRGEQARVADAPELGDPSESVIDRIRSAIHDGVLAPGDQLDPAVLATKLSTSPDEIGETLDRLRDIGIVAGRTGGPFQVATISPEQTADAMVVWVALYSALVNEVIPRATPDTVEQMVADHADFVASVGWAMYPSMLAAARAEGTAAPAGESPISATDIARANARFFDHLVTLSENPSLVRGIESVVHVIRLGTLHLPEYPDFKALSESQKLLLVAAEAHDRAAAQGALRMLGLINVPTAALEAEANDSA